jgi:adenine-specific DNA-methyltransferase
VDLIYIDPPFDTGADFSFTTKIPGSGEDLLKQPSVMEQKAYRDTWGRGLQSYLHWFSESATLIRDLLSDSASVYVHLDWHVGHYAKIILDEIFGDQNFRSEIIWKRTTAHSDRATYGQNHDVILFYSKGDKVTWTNPKINYEDWYVERYYRYKDADGRRFMSDNLSASGLSGGGYKYTWKGASGNWRCPETTMARLDAEGRIFYTENGIPRYKRHLDEMDGVPLQSLWDDVQSVVSWSQEATGFGTQKPEALLERIVNASSKESDLVLDCFCGSGTTAAVAEKLKRRWIACDLGRFAIHTTRKRLLGIPDVKPFIVQNLGKYERQQWQVAEFPANGKDRLAEQKERETGYRKFILELYHATPVSGHVWLHGVKGGRMVHVAAVDAPVTRADVNAIAAEVWKASGKGANSPQKPAVDVLGWEFALDMNETAKQVAAEARVDASFKRISRDVMEKKAVEQGDVYFFELGALAVDTKIKKREVTLTLSDFVIPSDDVPAEVRTAIKHWSQMVDYWAVDWDFKDDTFHNQWQSYRTRKSPKLDLTVKHEYVDPGKYAVVVKVIDILGNDTTKMLTVDIK